MAGWNTCCGVARIFRSNCPANSRAVAGLRGQPLPGRAGSHYYAAKHAKASRVTLRLCMQGPPAPISTRTSSSRSTTTQGRGRSHRQGRHGVLGMRERSLRSVPIEHGNSRRRIALRAQILAPTSHNAPGRNEGCGRDGRRHNHAGRRHAIVREGYRSLLQKQPRLKIVAEAMCAARGFTVCSRKRGPTSSSWI